MASSSSDTRSGHVRPSTLHNLHFTRQEPSFGSDDTAIESNKPQHPDDGWIDDEAGDVELQQSSTGVHPPANHTRSTHKRTTSAESKSSAKSKSCTHCDFSRRRKRKRPYCCGDPEAEGPDYHSHSKITACWRKCKRVLSKHDKSLVAGWKEDVDTLLVFSGLFSAALTAFVVESYNFLQPDPQGTTSNILREVLGELRNIRSGITAPPTADSEFPFVSDFSSSFAIRVNVFWFTSLVFSLASATIGILVKQWLRDYASHSGGSSREKARIRQLRHNGLLTFHIHEVIAFLPILLQWSLAFFFVGLVDLLWNLNFIVAAIVTCFVTATLAFLIVTTVLPALRADSPHRSPQALAVYLAYKAAIRLFVWLVIRAIGKLGVDSHPWPLYVAESQWSHRWRFFKKWLVKLLHERAHSNWREREQYLMRGQEVELDCQILVGADALYMDNKVLDEVIRPCIEEIPAPSATQCVMEIVTNRAHGTLDGKPIWKPSETLNEGIVVLAHLTLDVLARPGAAHQQDVLKLLDVLRRLCHAIRFEGDHPIATDLYERVYDTVAQLLSTGDAVGKDGFHLLYTLFSRAGASVRVSTSVIEYIVSFAITARDKREDSDTYFSACVMALHFGAKSSPEELHASRTHLQALLQEMAQYVHVTQTLPSPALLQAINTFAEEDSSPVMVQVRYRFEQLSQMVASIVNNIAASSSTTSVSARGLATG